MTTSHQDPSLGGESPPSQLPPPENLPLPLELMRLVGLKSTLSVAGKFAQLSRCTKTLLLPADLSFILASHWFSTFNPASYPHLEKIWSIPSNIGVAAAQLLLCWQPSLSRSLELIAGYAIANGSAELIAALWAAYATQQLQPPWRMDASRLEQIYICLGMGFMEALQNGVQDIDFIKLVKVLPVTNIQVSESSNLDQRSWDESYALPHPARVPVPWYPFFILALERSRFNALKTVIEHFSIRFVSMANHVPADEVSDWHSAVGKYCTPESLQFLISRGLQLEACVRGMMLAPTTDVLKYALSHGLNVQRRSAYHYNPKRNFTNMWDSGWRANVPEEQGWKGYILQCAAEADNMAAMRLLVDAGAPLKSTYPEDFNIIACHVRPSADISDRKQCNVETLTEMVTYLLAKGYRITDEDLAAVIDECDVETIRYILRFMDAADESLKGSATWTSLAAAIAADKMPADLVGTVFRKGPAHIWNIWTAYRMIEPAIAVNNAATLDIVKAVVEPLVEREPYESTIGFNGQWKCSPPIFYNVLQAGMWDVAEYLVESGGKEEFMGMVLPELRQEVGPNGGGGVKDLLMGIGADEFVRRIEVVEQKRKDPDWRNNGDAWF